MEYETRRGWIVCTAMLRLELREAQRLSPFQVVEAPEGFFEEA
jgi:hypothetical protein